MRQIYISLFALILLAGAVSAETQWYKGVTHVHSLWSDGDQAPELIAKWYKDRGYNFVCFSEHNVLQQGTRYVSITAGSKVSPERVEEIKETFGDSWLVLDEDGKNPRMKLKTHEELGKHFNEDGKFVLVNAEEVTSIGQSPHYNAINLRENIKPTRGPIPRVLQQYVNEVASQSKKYKVPMLGHINHMNFSDGVTAEDVLAVKGMRFMEVYNGHPSVNNWGHAAKFRPSNERLWDIILSMKQKNEPGKNLYGFSTDDSHNYYKWGKKESNPGRGWIMVNAESLDPDDLAAAMVKGDFYGSSGVTLTDVQYDEKTITVSIDAEKGAEYTTQFIGTRKGFDDTSKPVLDENGKELERTNRVYSKEIGVVLYETTDNPAVYKFSGEEIYVRALVTSSEVQENSLRDGDLQKAWVQPVLLK